jgi:hypothetical protein
VSLPPTITSLGRYCFDHTNLEGVVIVPYGVCARARARVCVCSFHSFLQTTLIRPCGVGVTEIPTEAFNSAGAHTPITATVAMPPSVKSIAADAFGGTASLCGGAAQLGFPECPESYFPRDEL